MPLFRCLVTIACVSMISTSIALFRDTQSSYLPISSIEPKSEAQSAIAQRQTGSPFGDYTYESNSPPTDIPNLTFDDSVQVTSLTVLPDRTSRTKTDTSRYLPAMVTAEPSTTFRPKSHSGNPTRSSPQHAATSILCSAGGWTMILIFILFVPPIITIYSIEGVFRRMLLQGVPEHNRRDLMASDRGLRVRVISISVMIPVILGLIVAGLLRQGVCEDLNAVASGKSCR